MNAKLLTAALVTLLAAACNGAPSDAPIEAVSLRVTTAGTTAFEGTGGAPGAALACPSPSVCFQLATDGANITHVFIDVDACCAGAPDDYDVLVDGQPVTQLHSDGGPCGGLPRDVWFPLQGNQSTAEVCLQFHGFVPGVVSVGAKAKSECVAATVTAACEVCAGGTVADGCSDGGNGGAGGAGGTGGTGGVGGGATGSGGAKDVDAGAFPIPQ